MGIGDFGDGTYVPDCAAAVGVGGEDTAGVEVDVCVGGGKEVLVKRVDFGDW